MARVGINGFGRIGRAFFRASLGDPEIEVVGINDLGDAKTLAYLLKYDSVYRTLSEEVRVENGQLIVGAKNIHFVSEKDPTKLPWGSLNIDVAIESTGVFDTYEKASAHLTAGAKHVVITAPVKDDSPNGATVLVGVNEEKLSTCQITSNASCTTNASSPLIAILDEKLGIEKALLNTTHAYTATQSIVDSPAKGDMRRGRAAAANIVPSSTGAAVAVTKAYEQLAGKFDGIAMRVPVVAGSLVDITFIAKRDTTPEEINTILTDAAREERWRGIFTVSNEPLVSSDIIGNPHASIADLSMTRVVGGNLVKVLAWYDNEMGYAHTLLRHVKAAAKNIKVSP
ncbi:MAG: glyceraldehyde-3-phosphate dehydrogenase, type I [Parcubacteria group bacterium Gr01-1014_56]|nr:MAG: glyceraldehyde-3-phosphate dehydrogenase, type I [Parcubacteria group bacterium Gr01-1014_56]